MQISGEYDKDKIFHIGYQTVFDKWTAERIPTLWWWDFEKQDMATDLNRCSGPNLPPGIPDEMVIMKEDYTIMSILKEDKATDTFLVQKRNAEVKHSYGKHSIRQNTCATTLERGHWYTLQDLESECSSVDLLQ